MEHSAADYRAHMNLPVDYTVDGLLVYGTWDLQAEADQLPALRRVLDAVGEPYTLRKLEPVQVGHAYELCLGGHVFWFVPVMGTAVLAQYLHLACLLGSRCNILLGIVGGLAPGIKTGDMILPTLSQGNDNARYYARDNTDGMYAPAYDLRARLLAATGNAGVTVWEGPTTTCEMMLAETLADVQAWSAAGYLGVEMEGALTFAASAHFGVPAAALFYVADNLIEAETMLHDTYGDSRDRRAEARHIQYVTALRVLREQVEIGR